MEPNIPQKDNLGCQHTSLDAAQRAYFRVCKELVEGERLAASLKNYDARKKQETRNRLTAELKRLWLDVCDALLVEKEQPGRSLQHVVLDRVSEIKAVEWKIQQL